MSRPGEIITVNGARFAVQDDGREIATRDSKLIGEIIPNAAWRGKDGKLIPGTGGWAYRFADRPHGKPRFARSRPEGREYIAAVDRVHASRTGATFPRRQSTPQGQAPIHSESSPLSDISTGVT